ncbi:MAG: TetR/AcrR family transcriptional regulator [Pseudomonas sp.]
MIAAARREFIAAGWQGTTIAGVARSAGVSNETIYAVFGSKENLLRAVVERSVRRADPTVPLLEQAGPLTIAAAVDQRTQIGLFASDITEVLGNVAEVMAVVRTAATTSAELLALYRSLHDARRRNLSFVAKALLAKGPLRHDMDVERATALLWRLASPELYLLLTHTEGLSAESYQEWLSGTLVDALLT